MGRPTAVKKAVERSEEIAQAALKAKAEAQETSVDDLITGKKQEPEKTADGPGSTPPDTNSSSNSDTHAARPDNQTDLQAEVDRLNAELTRSNNRNHTLQSKYNAEVPRLAAENRELRNEVTDLKGQVEQLKNNVNERKEQNQATEDQEKEIRGRLEEDLPEDVTGNLIQMVEAIVARTAPRQDGSKLETDLGQLRKDVNELRQKTTFEKLDELVPKWRTLNTDPEFNDFLDDGVEPLTGDSYRNILGNAWKAGEIHRVVQFFNLFLKNKGEVQEQTQQRKNEPLNGSTDVQPEASGSGAQSVDVTAGSSSQDRSFSMQEVREIDKAHRQGKFKGREAEYKQLRRQIEIAASKGMVG